MDIPEAQPFNSVPPVSSQPEPELKPEKKTGQKSKKIRFLLGLLLGIVVMAGALTAYVYNRPPSDPVVRAAVDIIPYPAVAINGERVSIKEYLKEYDALVNYFAGQEEAPSEDELAVTVVDTIVNKKILEQLADQYEVSVDESEVRTMMESVTSVPGAEGDFSQQLQENFGWSLEDFEARVVRSLVLANTMTEYVGNNQELQQDRRASIDEAKARLDNGEDFSVVAGEVSEDFSAKAGGDIGFVPMSEMVDPWLSAIADLEIGQVSEIVESPDNFMIFKVMDRITKEEDEEVQLAVIVVNKRTLDDVVEEYLANSEIKRYIGNI